MPTEARERRRRGKKAKPEPVEPGILDFGTLGERPLKKIADLPAGEPALVVLIVMDTLRADHTSLCGYGRPNTPYLEKAKARAKAFTCDAYSPAGWTYPSHASYFTGLPTADLDVHTLGTPLRDEFDTLAEIYAARGYQTLFVSGNPVFSERSAGFWQGFDRIVAAEGLRGALRDDLGKHVARELDVNVDPEAPLFLVINIFDAHDPYPAIPKGLSWVEPMERFSLQPHTADESNPYFRYVTGKMIAEEQQPYLQKITDAYDHAVYAADANLGLVLGSLLHSGWMKKPHRVVVTSDHGEHLGEHQLLRHGSATWQTVTRVPFLWLTNLDATPVTLPDPFSARGAFFLLRDGKLPAEPLLVEAASAVNKDDFKPSWSTVSVWGSPTDKLMWFDGEASRYDLAVDPGETKPLPIPADHPMKAILEARTAAHTKSVADGEAKAADPEVIEMMKHVGYVQ